LEVGNEFDKCEFNNNIPGDTAYQISQSGENEICWSQYSDDIPEWINGYATMLRTAKQVITEFNWNTKIVTGGLSSTMQWKTGVNQRLLKDPKRFMELLLGKGGIMDIIDGFGFHPTDNENYDNWKRTVDGLLTIRNTWGLPDKPYWLTESKSFY
jgi:hypothetical protein